MDRYPYHEYTILLGATCALAHIGVHFTHRVFGLSLMYKGAIKSEIDSILNNHTWELVDLPLGCKPLSSKYVFKRKSKVDGSIEKYKARLMIKGYRQTEGLDLFDTFSYEENKLHKDDACKCCTKKS